tara:strand:- start:445 stop:624 length:180 start_codon:yes stop_codon:yes gene_type:complete
MKVGDLVKTVSPAKIDGVSLRKGIVIQLNNERNLAKIVWSTGKETDLWLWMVEVISESR